MYREKSLVEWSTIREKLDNLSGIWHIVSCVLSLAIIIESKVKKNDSTIADKLGKFTSLSDLEFYIFNPEETSYEENLDRLLNALEMYKGTIIDEDDDFTVVNLYDLPRYEEIVAKLDELKNQMDELCSKGRHRQAIYKAFSFINTFQESELGKQWFDKSRVIRKNGVITSQGGGVMVGYIVEKEVKRYMSSVYERIADENVAPFFTFPLRQYFYLEAALSLLGASEMSQRNSITFLEDQEKIAKLLINARFPEEAKLVLT
jgi:hypothetical protein